MERDEKSQIPLSEQEDAALESRSGRLFSRTFQAFRYRDFRIMWCGAFTSTVGTWMQTISQAWLVFSLTGSPFYLGLIAFLGEAPIMLFSILGGAAADRIDRRKLLLGSQYVQMSSAFILTALIYWDLIQIWHFMLLVSLVGTAQAFGAPAYQSLIPGLVKRKDMPNAIALNSIQFNLARVLGPVLAGVVMHSLGPTACFALNGVSFLAVILSLLLIRSSFSPAPSDDSVWYQIKQGFRFVKGQGSLWQLSILGFASTFFGLPLLTLLPVFARDVFGLGSGGYANMMAFSGVGAVAGALLYANLSWMKNRGRFVLRVQLLLSALLALFAFSQNIYLACALLFLIGICMMSLFASINSLVQLTTTDEMRGRVMSIFTVSFRGGIPLGNLLAGAVASRVSPSFAILVGGVLLAAVASSFLAFKGKVSRLCPAPWRTNRCML